MSGGVGGGAPSRVPDEVLGTVVPIVVYWMYSGFYCLLQGVDRFRMHSRKEEEARNCVSKSAVVRGVLLQQAVQAAVSLALFAVIASWRFILDILLGKRITQNDRTCWKRLPSDDSEWGKYLGPILGQKTQNCKKSEESPLSQGSVLIYVKQFLVAMLVMDTWQYFMHRYMHHNKFLYRHVHSLHHRLVVPYSFGALYNHPVEGLLLDTVGGALSFVLSGMSTRTSIIFFTFATIKTVDDHCGLWLPGNPFHLLFCNNSAYHDIHHQLYGSKYNFSQPFFSMWDRILGTHLPYIIERKPDGGVHARPRRDSAVKCT